MTAHKPRVLVTRPEPGASQTARALEALGLQPLLLPLQETQEKAVIATTAPAGAAATAIPSASAIRHAPQQLIEDLKSLPCFAVGPATAQVARQAGFAKVIEAAGDAESMADMVLATKPAGTVVYLCGAVRRSVFEDRLAGAGVTVATVETYDTLPLWPSVPAMNHALGNAPIGHVLVYSANAAERLAKVMDDPDIGALLRDSVLVCISPRVADVLAGRDNKIVVATEPLGEALLNALQASVDLPS